MSGVEPRLARLVGAIAVALLLGALVWKLTRDARAHVPSGLAGVQLGSTLEEARAALPGLEGPGARARTRVFDEPATCTLELRATSKVSGIECVLDDSRARSKVLATLRELYGKETETREDSWSWRNKQAHLLLSASPALSLRLQIP